MAYKYHTLAMAAGDDGTADEAAGKAGAGDGGVGITVGKKAQPYWVRKIGETVLDMRVGRVVGPDGDSGILVLGERTMFTLRFSGVVVHQKRFSEDNPVSLGLYAPQPSSGPGGRPPKQNLLVGTLQKQLLVYQGWSLVWSAAMESVPIALAVAQFGDTRGLIVALDDEGTLTVNYLGTDPATSSVVPARAAEPDYEAIDAEHRRLLNIVREAQTSGGSAADVNQRLELRVTCPKLLDPPPATPEEVEAARELVEAHPTLAWSSQHAAGGSGLVSATARLFVKFIGSGEVRNVDVAVSAPDYVFVRENSFHIPVVRGGSATPLVFPIVLCATTALLPNELCATVTATYQTASGQPRTATAAFDVPLGLACHLEAPQANGGHGNFKLTLDTNRPPCQLVPLFEDMVAQLPDGEDAAQVIGSTANSVLCFRYHFLAAPDHFPGGEEPRSGEAVDATILVSKSSGRYRIQSSSLPAIYLICSELVKRLQARFGSDGGSDGGEAKGEDTFRVTYSDQLPFQDFFAVIDHHFDCRGGLLEANSLLNDRAHQYRVIEKRLLVRFKDKNPAPLAQLDEVLSETHQQIVELGHRVEEAQRRLKRAANALSCTTGLVLLLIQFCFALGEEDMEVLRTFLTPQVQDNVDQGWEEQVDAALTHLLKTSLAKTAKEASMLAQPLSMPRDTSKLKRHITIVCDRLAKGAMLASGGGGKK
uniref:PTHB1 N-terminal domain-containing protein n=1 Tax=Rhizochromulina marina TaxID=1034831 RepID=A0A7S2WDC7_9STRA